MGKTIELLVAIICEREKKSNQDEIKEVVN